MLSALFVPTILRFSCCAAAVLATISLYAAGDAQACTNPADSLPKFLEDARFAEILRLGKPSPEQIHHAKQSFDKHFVPKDFLDRVLGNVDKSLWDLERSAGVYLSYYQEHYDESTGDFYIGNDVFRLYRHQRYRYPILRYHGEMSKIDFSTFRIRGPLEDREYVSYIREIQPREKSGIIYFTTDGHEFAYAFALDDVYAAKGIAERLEQKYGPMKERDGPSTISSGFRFDGVSTKDYHRKEIYLPERSFEMLRAYGDRRFSVHFFLADSLEKFTSESIQRRHSTVLIIVRDLTNTIAGANKKYQECLSDAKDKREQAKKSPNF